MKRIYQIFLSLSFFFTALAHAETVVLIHGYLSNSGDWEANQVTKPLLLAGWQYGGNYTNTRTAEFGVSPPPQSSLKAPGKHFFTVDLPADASIEIQSRILGFYLQHLYSQRQEPLVLVGHSAGGVVARAWLIKSRDIPVKALITIASPHLGTPLASLAELGIKTPLNEAARMLGIKNFRKSRAIFSDLKEEKPGNFLYWLNHQPHPTINYISIIRRNKAEPLEKFDYVVPRKSQNMNNIWAIKGLSAVLLTTGDHFLDGNDGIYLKDLFTLIYNNP